MGRLFVVSLAALKEKRSCSRLRAGLVFIIAKNEDEAMGKAIRFVKKIYPAAEGYSDQTVTVFAVSQDLINKVK